ncbi:MAG: hypothetical protein ACRC62_11805 [Microcoleus sp.]
MYLIFRLKCQYPAPKKSAIYQQEDLACDRVKMSVRAIGASETKQSQNFVQRLLCVSFENLREFPSP